VSVWRDGVCTAGRVARLPLLVVSRSVCSLRPGGASRAIVQGGGAEVERGGGACVLATNQFGERMAAVSSAEYMDWLAGAIEVKRAD